MNRVLKLAILAGVIFGAFLGGQIVRLYPWPSSTRGLPGGGHHCCYRPGYVSTCTGEPITTGNIQALCNAGCVPIQLLC